PRGNLSDLGNNLSCPQDRCTSFSTVSVLPHPSVNGGYFPYWRPPPFWKSAPAAPGGHQIPSHCRFFYDHPAKRGRRLGGSAHTERNRSSDLFACSVDNYPDQPCSQQG